MAIDMVDPLDYLILGVLPEEGSLVLGAYPDGKESFTIGKEALNDAVSPNIIGRRLGVMHAEALVVKVRAPKTKTGFTWQRTAAGKAVFQDWKSKKEADNGNQ